MPIRMYRDEHPEDGLEAHLPGRAQVTDHAHGDCRRAKRDERRVHASGRAVADAACRGAHDGHRECGDRQSGRNLDQPRREICCAKSEQQAGACQPGHDDLLNRAGVDGSLHGHGQDTREQQKAIAAGSARLSRHVATYSGIGRASLP